VQIARAGLAEVSSNSERKEAGFDSSTPVYKPFRKAHDVYKEQLGGAVSLERSTGPMPIQSYHEHAMVFWSDKPSWFYKLPFDGKRNWEFEQDPTWDDRPIWRNEKELRKLFKPPKGRNAPRYGIASHWDKNRENWSWIGWRVWDCLFFDDQVFIQEFQHGKLLGPLRKTPEQSRAQVIVIFDNGSWTHVDIDVEAPACRKPPSEEKKDASAKRTPDDDLQRRKDEALRILHGKNRVETSKTSPQQQHDESRPAVPRVQASAPQAIVSPYAELPYGLQTVISTTVALSPLNIRLDCDGPIGKATWRWTGAFPGAVLSAVNEQIKGNSYYFRLDTPRFVPEMPVLIKLYSASPLRIVHLEVGRDIQ
jgi:hypothetical protein